MKALYLLITISLFCNKVLAQDPIDNKISGIVHDDKNSPIPGASLMVIGAKDSALQKTGISDADGQFELKNLKAGQYLLIITAVGYNKFTSDPISIDSLHSSISLQTIQLLQSDAKVLKGVSVTARKPYMEQQIDRLVLNVDALITNAGTTALDVLSKSPGVSVSSDGSISLNGKSGILVLLDGRPTYLSSQDLANYLKAMPSASLDKIELMTNPPAKYDAAGTGVINIRTKKNRIKGFFGSISANYSQANYWRSNDALDLNYRNNKVNLFANIGYAGDRNFVNTDVARYYVNSDGTPSSEIQMAVRNKNVADAVNLKLGMDYFLSPKTTMGVIFTGLYRPKSEEVNTTSRVYDGNHTLDSIAQGTLNGKYKWKNGGVNLNLQHRIDSTGKEITVDLDYIRYNSDGNLVTNNYVYAADQTLARNYDRIGVLPVDITVYSGKVDYSGPVGTGGRFDAGVKSSYVKTDNAAEYYNRVNNVTTPDYDYTNRFLYDENINAGYLNFNKEFKRWSFQAGLRLENTIANGHQLGNVEKSDSSFRRDYTSLFPTAYLSYKLDSAGNHTLGLSYGRRINRPAYQDLNPFLYFMDQYSYSAGNPYLKPQYLNHYEFSYHFRQYINAMLVYDKSKDMITQTIEQSGNVFIARNANIGENTVYGLLLNSSLNPTKWYMCNAHLEFLNFGYKGPINSEYIDENRFSWGIGLMNQFRFNKGWAAEVYAMYRSSTRVGQFIRDPVNRVDAGVMKNILKDKGSLKLSVQDIFYSMIIKGKITNLQQATATDRNLSDSRVIGLTFNYRFGKEISGSKRNHNSSAESEQQRVKTNN
ncbi:TonB-dependent receptor [[Flexibacter] sp. ATCC 35208]|uniref:TonB-dependent receptor n=1 Tax=[Flexibacter] sp. ATCC 35208 TaxID=1936242 RepID=UPI0009D3059A|nr:TonB-dependent receptor [[Flexibacter] sp. ATCC 35208]OMP77898.1 hypothetical protein BW716_17635 [[Flexibacter] sp. ATCC 35208]